MVDVLLGISVEKVWRRATIGVDELLGISVRAGSS